MPVSLLQRIELLRRLACDGRRDGNWPVTPHREWVAPRGAPAERRMRARATAVQYLRPRNALRKSGGRPKAVWVR